VQYNKLVRWIDRVNRKGSKVIYDLDTRQIAIEWLQKAIMESLETDGMEDQAGLILALHEIDFDNATGHEEFAKRVVEKFVEKLGVTANNARGFLFGGQVDTAPFEAAGYNWKADTYGGNKEFWDHCGISVMEFAAVWVLNV
jgi:hypothetical protein